MNQKSQSLIRYLALGSAAVCLLWLSGCSLIPMDKFKPAATPAAWIEPLPSTQAHDGKLSDLKHWWQQFNDPQLIQLIEAAQAVSSDIESAKARVAASQAAAIVAESQLLPTVTAEASASRSRTGLVFPTGNAASVDVTASWELDVWGKNKADSNEEQAKLVGTKALWHDARVIVAAETAKQYINYRLCENLSDIAQKNADSTAKTEQLSQLTAKAGFLAPSSLSQSEGQAAEAVNQLKKQLLQCTLIVKSLVAITAIPEPKLRGVLANNAGVIPMPAGIEVTAVPAKMLEQRPDVLNAERNVAAASFEIAYTVAQRYPRLSLSGSIGLTYDTSARNFLLNRRHNALDGLTWSIGPIAVSLPLFDAGVREANISAAKAQYEAAKSVYENVVRNAVREVEEALATLNSTAQREADVAKAADRFQISYAASQARYQASLANLFELEEARRASLQAENSVFTLQNERVLAWISLYHAMGGGWTAEQNTLPQNTPLTLDRGLMPQAEGAALEDVQPAVPAPQETKSLTPVP
ncbi:MAG: efflux transporter outer membrane subunit [Pseudomonadota bacterium]